MNMLQPAQIRYCCAVFFLFVCLVIYRCSGRFFCVLIAFLGSIIQLLWLPEHWVQEKSNHMSCPANFYCISHLFGDFEMLNINNIKLSTLLDIQFKKVSQKLLNNISSELKVLLLFPPKLNISS